MKRKQLVIVLDGVDMCGKTNIGEALSKELQIPMYKNPKEQNRWQDKLISLIYGMQEIVELLRITKYSLILDRFHASEWVYSRVFGRKSHDETVFDQDEKLASCNGIIIYLYKNSEKYLADDQDIVKIEQYDELKKYYEEFLKLTKMKVIRLCTDDEDLPSQIKYLKEEIEKCQH